MSGSCVLALTRLSKVIAKAIISNVTLKAFRRNVLKTNYCQYDQVGFTDLLFTNQDLQQFAKFI